MITFKADLKKLDRKSREALKRVIYRIVEDPTRFKSLRGKSKYYRVRLGIYRLVYKLEGKRITLMFIKKREIAYKRP